MVNALVLKGFALFRGLNDDELAKIAELCTERTMNEGDIIFSEGTRATSLHLCRSGKVDIVIWAREPWNKNVTVHRAEPGEVYGWAAVVAPYTRTATTICAESGEEICIKGSALLELFEKHPHIGLIIMTNLASDIIARLTQTRQQLSVEWLNSASSAPSSSTIWGEPKKR